MAGTMPKSSCKGKGSRYGKGLEMPKRSSGRTHEICGWHLLVARVVVPPSAKRREAGAAPVQGAPGQSIPWVKPTSFSSITPAFLLKSDILQQARPPARAGPNASTNFIEVFPIFRVSAEQHQPTHAAPPNRPK